MDTISVIVRRLCYVFGESLVDVTVSFDYTASDIITVLLIPVQVCDLVELALENGEISIVAGVIDVCDSANQNTANVVDLFGCEAAKLIGIVKILVYCLGRRSVGSVSRHCHSRSSRSPCRGRSWRSFGQGCRRPSC